MEIVMRSALIRDGIVENIIMAGEDYDPGEGCIVVPIGTEPVEIGAIYDGSSFAPPALPPAPVPEAVTARQARLALLGVGKLAMVEGALAAIPGVQGEAARIEWEYASEVQRHSPLINALAPMLGLTAAQVDDLFRAAEGL
jgi:hypothetical protein